MCALKLSEAASNEYKLALRQPEKSGWIAKKGAKRRNWTSRFFTLKGSYLFYSKEKTSTSPQGVINLHGCSIAIIEGPTIKSFSFTLLAPKSASADSKWMNRTYFFRCQTALDRHNWMEKIIDVGSSKNIPVNSVPDLPVVEEKKYQLPPDTETHLSDIEQSSSSSSSSSSDDDESQ